MLAYDMTFMNVNTHQQHKVHATERKSLTSTSDLAKAFIFLAGLSTLFALELVTVDNFSDTEPVSILEMV